MRYLEAKGTGFAVGPVRVPIVPAAVLFDLGIGDPAVRPDAAMGYAACEAASASEMRQGNIGAGTGATVGKLVGMGRATKGGLGTASLRVGRLVVGALVAVNAFGDVVDPDTGRVVAGLRSPTGKGFADSSRTLQSHVVSTAMGLGNTVIGVIATNARLDVAEVGHLAAAAHDGLARVIRPAHTIYDGDTLFALSTGRIKAARLVVDDLAAHVTALAVLNAVRSAESAGGVPSAAAVGGAGR